MKIKYIIWILLGLILTACVDEIRPKLDKFENALVVDGQITNQPGPYRVTLSISSSLDIIKKIPVEGANVFIIEESGETETLIEIAPGDYETSESGIRGVAGKSYKLRVITPEGKQYESEFQELIPTTPIDTIEAEVEYKFYPEEDREIPGYQFYLKGGQTDYNNDYYLWTYEETFNYQSDLEIHFVYDNRMITRFDDPIAYKTCWKTAPVKSIATYSTLGLGEKRITIFPLNFVRADDKRLSIRYSLLLKQYSINEEAYTFWQSVESQITNLSALYTTQPFQLRGNVKNVENPDEPVLGYFMVAGLSEKRVFVNPPTGLNITLPECALDFDGYRWIFGTPRSEWPVYIHQTPQGARAIAGPGCMDCRELGGVLEKPDFW